MQIENLQSVTRLQNGLKMPVLGLGVYKMSDKEAFSSVKFALENGYRHIDTASFYQNETAVGKAIKESGVPRDEIFVTSKIWITEQGYDEAKHAIENSLQRLDSSYIDLYLIHWPTPGKFTESWKAMEEYYKAGKLKAIGLSNCLIHQIEEIRVMAAVMPMVLQNEFHPRLVQQELLDYCKNQNIQYEAWAPLMRGQILDHKIIKNLAEKYRKTPAQIVIRWDLQKGVVTIPKSVHENRIIENSRVFDFQLSVEEIKQIDALDREERTGAHPDGFMDYFREKGEI